MKKQTLSSSAKSIIKASGPIKWTNRYDCPPGYIFNDMHYVVTNTKFVKLWANTAPHMFSMYTVAELLYYNLLILTTLNPDKPFHTILSATKYALKDSIFSKTDIPTDVVNTAVERYTNFEGNILEELNKDFYRLDDIWYSEDSDITTTLQIVYLIKEEAIDRTRDLMSIATKYKTKDVSSLTAYSMDIIRKYWKHRGLTTTLRTLNTVSDAYMYLKRKGISSPTLVEVAKIAGLSTKSVSKVKRQLQLSL